MVCLGIQTRRSRLAQSSRHSEDAQLPPLALIAVAATRVRHAVVAMRRLPSIRLHAVRTDTEGCNSPKQMRDMLALRRDMSRYAWGEAPMHCA